MGKSAVGKSAPVISRQGTAAQGAAPAADARAPVSLDQLRELARAIGKAREEPAWLVEGRLQALEAYGSMGLPDRVGHLWRYTDPGRFLPQASKNGLAPDRAPAAGLSGSWPEELRGAVAELAAACSAPALSSTVQSSMAPSSAALSGAAWVSSGRLQNVALDPALAKAGVVIEDLHRASETRKELVRRSLGTLVPASSGKFEALNAALWQGGLLIHVARGVDVPRPIHLLSRLDGAALMTPRLLIVAEAGSRVTVIDEYVGGDRGSVVHATVESFAAESASLRTVTIQRLGGGAALHVSQRARLERDAKLVAVWASLGGLVAKADLGTVLAGPGGEVELLGFLFGEGRQHFDHHTVHDHQAPHTHSDLDFKVVLKDHARSAYTGLIRIAPEAPNSEAYQENRNLLLNEGTKADSIPELEILTDEVMCTHGATMGSLDPEHLFYLVSRGIPRAEAARMVVAGFIEPTLTRLPEDLRERIRVHLEEGLRTIGEPGRR